MIEIEGDGSQIQEQAGIKSSTFVSSKPRRELLKTSVSQKIAKAVEQLHLGRTPGGTPMSADKGQKS